MSRGDELVPPEVVGCDGSCRHRSVPIVPFYVASVITEAMTNSCAQDDPVFLASNVACPLSVPDSRALVRRD